MKEDELWTFFEIKNYFSSDFGSNAAAFGASFPAVASHVMKGFALLRDKESKSPTVADLINLGANDVTDFLLGKE